MKRLHEFWNQYQDSLRKIILFLAVCILLSCLVFLILYLTKVIQFDNGLVFNSALFENIKTEWYGYLTFFLIQVIVTVLLCFAPGGSATFIALGVVLYGPTWQCFLLVFSGVIASSLLMDLLGRFGGSFLLQKLFSKADYDKGMALLQEKGIVYLPVMYLLPVFPDDLLCCLAGMSKIKFWYHTLIILLCRGVGCATIVFGISLIPYQEFTTPWEWIQAITIVLFWVILLFYLARLIDKKLTAYLKKKQTLKEKEK